MFTENTQALDPVFQGRFVRTERRDDLVVLTQLVLLLGGDVVYLVLGVVFHGHLGR